MNNILDAFRFRYACKKFDKTKVIPADQFQQILEAARLSPSSWGMEPWKFLVVQNEELRQKLFPLAWGAQNSLAGASHFVILLARRPVDTLAKSDYTYHMLRDIHQMPEDVVSDMEGAYQSWQTNDFGLTASDHVRQDWAAKQTYIALANMMTVAATMGIDSCPIEGFNIRKVEDLLVNEGLLDTTHFGVSVMAGFGYRGEDPHREKSRQLLDDIVQWVK